MQWQGGQVDAREGIMACRCKIELLSRCMAAPILACKHVSSPVPRAISPAPCTYANDGHH